MIKNPLRNLTDDELFDDETVEKAIAQTVDEANRDIIDQVKHSTCDLIERMTRRKEQLEHDATKTDEELRQVNLVLKGSKLLLDTIEPKS